jgi:MFS transporter, putative metabolite:H+ symporter
VDANVAGSRRQDLNGPPTLNIPARLERLPFTRFHRRLFFAVATAYFFDTLDVAILTFVLAPISTDYGLSGGASGLLASSSFAGMGIGAAVAGALADRFGRRPVFAYSMLLWGVASLLMIFSWDLGSLLLLRFITGIGLGAELPVAQALLSEILPADRRGRYMGWMQGSIPLAFIAGALISLALVSTVGWRGVFVLMFVLSVFGLVIRHITPESPRWCESRGQFDKAEATMLTIEEQVRKAWGKPLPEAQDAVPASPAPSTAAPWQDLLSARYLGRTLTAWGMWLFGMIGYYAIVAWIAKLLVDKGISVTSSISLVLLMYLWGIPGFLLSSYFMERIGRKPVVATAIALSSVAAYLYGSAETLVSVVIAGSVLQFCLMGMWVGIYTYTPELFPTRARATGSGTASTAGRIGGLLGPSLVPPLLLAWGSAGTFAAISTSFLVAALLVVVIGPETRGRTVEELAE